MAKKGYDVWIGNSRGNFFSNKHISYLFNSEEFWNISFGNTYFDTLAVMKTIKLVKIGEGLDSSKIRVNYIGHSQGCTSIIAAMGNTKKHPRLDLESLIGSIILLSPVILSNTKYLLGDKSNFLMIPCLNFLRKIGIHYFDFVDCNPTSFRTKFINFLVDFFPEFMRSIAFGIVDHSHKLNSRDNTFIKKFFLTHITGMSFKGIIHFLQQRHKGSEHLFRKFDYGEIKNLELYGTKYAENVDFSLIKNEILILAGDSDNFIKREGLIGLKKELNESKFVKIKMYKGWGHTTTIFSNNF